ncbi:MAG: hypothetical protein PHE89_01310 [Alphaproteobacteria bacterium]|nr:hypothetical protein [Alphaproteobacteria bacterium]
MKKIDAVTLCSLLRKNQQQCLQAFRTASGEEKEALYLLFCFGSVLEKSVTSFLVQNFYDETEILVLLKRDVEELLKVFENSESQEIKPVAEFILQSLKDILDE